MHTALSCICGTKMEYNSATKECVDDSSAPELGSKTVFVQMLDTNTWGMGLYVMCAASCPSVDFQLLCRYESAPNGVLVRVHYSGGAVVAWWLPDPAVS